MVESASASQVASDPKPVVSESAVSDGDALSAYETEQFLELEINQQSQGSAEDEPGALTSESSALLSDAEAGSQGSEAQRYSSDTNFAASINQSDSARKIGLDQHSEVDSDKSETDESLHEALDEASDEPKTLAHTDQVVKQPELAESSQSEEPVNLSEQKQKLIERLKPEHVSLSGDWDLSKWCYWIDQAQLEPSVASLAKKGLMQGSITGHSQLSFAASSKIIVEAFGGKLKTALEESLSGIEVVYEFGALSGPTPETEQNKRKRVVQQQAEQYLREESLIEVLERTYQAELGGVTLSLS